MEVAQNTMLELTKDKDELITSQKTLIVGMQKDADSDINSDRIKLSENMDIITQQNAEFDKCKMEIMT